MITWLKLNKFKILGTVIIIIFSIVNSYVSGRYMYNKAMKASDRVIMGIKQDIRDSDSRARAAIVRAREAEIKAKTARTEKEKHMANVIKIEKEKQRLKDKIEALPPTQIVMHTIEILMVEPQEITLQSQGVLFSLMAARKNLGILEGFTLVKKQFFELTEAFIRSSVEGLELQEANTGLKKAISEKDTQIAKWPAIEREWEQKFSLSNTREKQGYWRGLKTGTVIGVALVVLIKLAF